MTGRPRFSSLFTPYPDFAHYSEHHDLAIQQRRHLPRAADGRYSGRTERARRHNPSHRSRHQKTHPDLIVFTGDQIRGYDPAYIDTFLRRRGERPGTRVRIVTKIEAKLRGIKRHPLAKALREYPPTDDSWMIDGIGTDSPKLVKRNKRDGLNGSANKLESWAQSINRATAATILDDTRQKVRDTFAAFLGPALEARIPFAATYGNHDFQCGILADEQDDIYREFSGCMNPVAGSSPLALEPGTFAIPIEASDGSKRIAMSVMMVNSGDYADNAFDGDCSISDGCERVGDTDKSGNTVGNTAGGRESLTSYANMRRIHAAGIWPIPTATAHLRRKRSNG